MIGVAAPSREQLRPNWFAIASLFLVVSSWLALALRVSSFFASLILPAGYALLYMLEAMVFGGFDGGPVD